METTSEQPEDRRPRRSRWRGCLMALGCLVLLVLLALVCTGGTCALMGKAAYELPMGELRIVEETHIHADKDETSLVLETLAAGQVVDYYQAAFMAPYYVVKTSGGERGFVAVEDVEVLSGGDDGGFDWDDWD